MASKLYLEILQNIFKYHKDDFETLHSILLVNRLWARVVIEILWRNPFKFAHIKIFQPKIYYVYKTYKELLNIYRHFIDDGDGKELLFDYPSFLKTLNWKYLRFEEDGVQLFSMFIKKNKRISKLKINDLSRGNERLFFIDQEIVQRVTPLSQISSLKINNKNPLYIEIFSNSLKNLNTLIIDCYSSNHNGLSKFIRVQKNLKKLIIKREFPDIKEGIKFQSNSITHIKLAKRKYLWKNNSLINLQYCINLELLEFSNWNLDNEDSQLLLRMNFPNLKSLIFDYSTLDCEDLI
ncbi:8591_t:CDS:1, partial [Funneliformis geosporum]